MIKKTNKVTANKIMLDVNEDGVIMVHEFDKDGFETSETPLTEIIQDFIGKEYVGFSLGYDKNM